MTSLFLYLFLVGFGLTLVSVVLGMVDFGGDAGAGDADLAHLGDHAGDLAHGHGHAKHFGKISTISPINFQTVVALMMGFGGVGYVASRLLPDPLLALTLLAALAGGLVIAWLIFKVQRFLQKGERPMGQTAYTGIVGKLTVPIRAGGTGEVVYQQQESRMVSAARSVDGRAIARGEEVVILRYEKGVAYVQLWRDLMDPSQKQRG